MGGAVWGCGVGAGAKSNALEAKGPPLYPEASKMKLAPAMAKRCRLPVEKKGTMLDK